MEKLVYLYAVIGAGLLLCGIGTSIFGGLSDHMTIQVAGLTMIVCAMPLFFEVRIHRLEIRLRELESKLGQQLPA